MRTHHHKGAQGAYTFQPYNVLYLIRRISTHNNNNNNNNNNHDL